MSRKGHPAFKGSALRRLSRRERRILKLVVEGKTNKEIAALLHQSLEVIHAYRIRIKVKMEIEDFASLVKFAARNKITVL
jgi:DNA-binding NarL/FixJ family response regulator